MLRFRTKSLLISAGLALSVALVAPSVAGLSASANAFDGGQFFGRLRSTGQVKHDQLPRGLTRTAAGVEADTTGVGAAALPDELIPAFTNFTAPAPLARDAAEPSLGVNWNTGNVMFQAYTETDRVSFNDTTNPPTATWTNVSAPNAVISLDPILFTDPITGRTVTSQLVSPLALAPGVGCSLAAVSPDDGTTWIPSTGCGVPGTADHQTIGGGPYADPDKGAISPRAMYYCGQNGYFANCSLSVDGGVTWGPGVPTHSDLAPELAGGSCMGLHGHVKVGPDGTAYLPDMQCEDAQGTARQGMAVSEDDGLSWTVKTIPDSLYNDFRSDPAVGIGSANTIYFAYEDVDGAVKVAISRNHGDTWTDSFDLGAPVGVKYGVFPAVVAGDDDRAAVAFLGTKDVGDENLYEGGSYAGVWHLYVSMTYDGGATWTTVDATPTDPVQRGCVWWGNDGGCPSAQRNLLDFMDVQIDKLGRVLVGYADGCINSCVQGGANTREDVGVIARQSNGWSLFSQYDAQFTPPPQ